MIGDLAAAPADGASGYGGIRVSLTACWADSAYTRKKNEEGTPTSSSPCGAYTVLDVGLCEACYEDVVGSLLETTPRRNTADVGEPLPSMGDTPRRQAMP